MRLELTTSACLIDLHPAGWGGFTAYKYGALTDCATGAVVTLLILVYFNMIYTGADARRDGIDLSDVLPYMHSESL